MKEIQKKMFHSIASPNITNKISIMCPARHIRVTFTRVLKVIRIFFSFKFLSAKRLFWKKKSFHFLIESNVFHVSDSERTLFSHCSSLGVSSYFFFLAKPPLGRLGVNKKARAKAGSEWGRSRERRKLWDRKIIRLNYQKILNYF